MEDDILTIEEVAKYLRVSDRTVYDWAQKGEIPAGKIGTVWRFKKSEVENWVNARLSSCTFKSDSSEILVKNNFYNDAALAETSISDCGAVCITGKEMRTLVNLNISALYSADPESAGGSLPDDGFCYIQ